MYRISIGKRHRRDHCKGMYLSCGASDQYSGYFTDDHSGILQYDDDRGHIWTLEQDFTAVCDEMATLGEEIGVTIHCQREEIFEKMHRL